MRKRYREAVKEDVEDRFRASLHHARFIDLGVEDDPAAVKPPWGYYNPERKETYASIWDAFQGCQGRLLLLGHPGAGKTTALLHIASELLRLVERSDDAPVPVIVNLSKFRLIGAVTGKNWLGRTLGVASTAVGESVGGSMFEDWFVGEMATFPGLD
ncbi:MAG: hypothetical protein JO255_04240, partial [Alphaproteobacteria bacterium]|nr:hypothetical protein [Alphaproteobacteria bacterium]